MEEKRTPKRPIIFYYVIMMIILMLLNALVFPLFLQPRVKEVDYGTFIRGVEDGSVTAVQIDSTSSQIAFILKDAEGKETVCKTGQMYDPELTNRLLARKDLLFTEVIPKQMNPILSFLLTWIFPVVIFVVIGQFIVRFMQKKMGGPNAMQFGKSNAKIYVQAQTGKTFDDVAGEDEAKDALKEIVDFLHNPEKYTDIGAAMPKGALLVGPPGTGKTLLARAVAGEAKVPFFSISGSEFVEMFVGMGAAKVRDLFKQAQEKAPCIVFIDEIDTIGKKRDTGAIGGNDEREQTLNQLLTEMDGFDGKKGVVILAATNRPDSLDPALLRPGRFDRRIPVELPDLSGREAILRVHAQKVRLSTQIDFNAIARATSGASGAELANIVNEAALRAVKFERNSVNQSDLEEAVETVIAGYQRKSAVISPKEKEIVAYHEIGHALVAAMQTDSAPVHKITIIPRTSGALGYTMQIEEGERVLMSKEEAFNRIATMTGGRAAEELIYGTFTSGASNDIEQATKLARSMVTRLGMSNNFDMMALETVQNQYLGGDAALTCSPETASKIDSEVLKIICSAHQKASSILKEHLAVLKELATYLLEKETISGEEFLDILKSNGRRILPEYTASEEGEVE